MVVLDNVSKTYPTNNVEALKNISFKIPKGEFVYLMGESGSGKSTLINLLLRDFTADSGDIIVDGENINAYSHAQIPYYRRKIGVVFQDYRLFSDMDVYDNLDFAAYISGVPRKQIGDKVEAALLDVGINNKRIVFSLPKRLSGGEQQRVAIARAILNRPKLILADEPTGNLDDENAENILALFDEINKKYGTTILMATHNTSLIELLSKRTLRLHLGRLVADENPAEKGQENAQKE